MRGRLNTNLLKKQQTGEGTNSKSSKRVEETPQKTPPSQTVRPQVGTGTGAKNLGVVLSLCWGREWVKLNIREWEVPLVNRRPGKREGVCSEGKRVRL